MKHLILLICLLGPLTTLNAGWFSKGPDPLDQAQEKISFLEGRIIKQSATLSHWQIISATLGISCVLLLIIGTALGSKTRHHHQHDHSRRLGPTPSTPPSNTLNGRKSALLDEAAEENTHSTLAA